MKKFICFTLIFILACSMFFTFAASALEASYIAGDFEKEYTKEDNVYFFAIQTRNHPSAGSNQFVSFSITGDNEITKTVLINGKEKSEDVLYRYSMAFDEEKNQYVKSNESLPQSGMSFFLVKFDKSIDNVKNIRLQTTAGEKYIEDDWKPELIAVYQQIGKLEKAKETTYKGLKDEAEYDFSKCMYNNLHKSNHAHGGSFILNLTKGGINEEISYKTDSFFEINQTYFIIAFAVLIVAVVIAAFIIIKKKILKKINGEKMKKVVLISGGSRGIGASLVREFSKNNYAVAFLYNKNQTDAFNLIENIKKYNNDIKAYKCDISNEKEIIDVLKIIKKDFFNIDILINNAGISKVSFFDETSALDLNELIDVNVKGTFFLSKYVIKDMIKQKWGKIINISSMWGVSGASMEVAYSTTKSAVIGFTKALAKEVAPSNINVNCIAPGVINTDMNKNLTSETLDLLKDEIPLGRIGEPLDIAKCALFLASEDSSYITGQIIGVNGGMVI